MSEQTAIALSSGKKALVAGLSWQPLLQTGYSQKVSEIRALADRIDASRHILIKTPSGDHVGLYNFDADMSDEERTGKVYSLAAAFAATLQAGSAMLAYRISEGPRSGSIAVVVIDDGAPSLDMVAGESEAVTTIDTYLSSGAGKQAYPLYTNVPDLFPSGQLVSSEFFSDGFASRHALIGLPNDMIKLSGLLVVVLLMVGGLFGVNEYLDIKEQERLAEEAQSRIQLPEYLQALEQQRRTIGLSGAETLSLLNQLAEQPAVARGWVLETITCNKGNCTSQWASRGGYTQELIGFLPDQRPTINYANANTLSFAFSVPATDSGIAKLSDLPTKPAMKDLIFTEKQAWDKSGLQTTANNTGAVWPTGFPNVPPDRAVFQYPLDIKGSMPLVTDFLQRYPNHVFWSNLTLRLSPENPTAGVMVELKGAFYGY